MIQIEFGKSSLRVEGSTIDRPHAYIRELLYDGGTAYVTYEYTRIEEETIDRNVLAVNRSGISWRIEACPEWPRTTAHPWGGVYFDEDSLWAFSRNGYTESQIDADSGEILSSRTSTNNRDTGDSYRANKPPDSPGRPYRVDFFDRHLFIRGEKELFFNGYIKDMVYHQDLLLVLFSSAIVDEKRKQNVYAVDQDGLAWMIEPVTFENPEFEHLYYRDIEKNDEGDLWLRSICNKFDADAHIDPGTGEVIETRRGY